jgi:hypothetical protein
MTVEGSGLDKFWNLPGGTWGNRVRIVAITAEILTGHLPDTSQKRNRLSFI